MLPASVSRDLDFQVFQKNGEKYLEERLKEGLTLGWGDRHFSLVKVIRVKRNLKS